MILHIDMDAFYASVEVLDNPEFAGKPVIVGGLSGRGVVAAASYEARMFGVHSAMPMFLALKKCPDAKVVPPRKDRYKQISRQFMAILKSFSPLVEQVSIDEAFLDASGCHNLFGSPEFMARQIKNKIKQHLRLTCSVGIAPVKFLAKIASDMHKPDGLTMIPVEKVHEFVRALPVKDTPGVGPKIFQKLNKLGITTLGDVRDFPENMLEKKLGKFGKRLKELSRGIDKSPVTPFSVPKSISAEETMPLDTADTDLLKKYLLNHAVKVAQQLRKTGFKAKTIFIKLKYSDFNQLTRSTTIQTPTCSSKTLYREACRLFEDCERVKKIRLVGLGVSGLVKTAAAGQMALFDISETEEKQWEKVDKTIDLIQERFGKNILKRAILTGD